MSNQSTLNAIRANGQAYHYRIGCGLVWLLDVVDDATATTYLNEVAALPSAADSHTLAQQSLHLVKGYAETVGANYSAIFTVLNEALQETA